MIIKRLLDTVVATSPVIAAMAMDVHPAWYIPISAASCLWVKKRRKQRRSSLDDKLFSWPDKTPYTIRDLMQGVAIFGQIGSGKTSGSGLALARAAVGLRNSGGLVLASKPEDRDFWLKRFKEAGRSNDLIIFSPDQPARCNFLDYEMQCGGDSRSITQFMMVTGEALSEGGRENEQFWKMSQERMIYNTVEAVRQGHGRITIPDLQQFISTAAYHPSQFKAEKWQEGFHYQTMLAASQKVKTAIEKHDFSLCRDYWTNEFVYLDEKPRSSIMVGVMNIFHQYNVGIVREMVSTASTVTPDALGQGKWVLVDLPLDKYGVSGKIMMHGWKYLVQKAVLRRHVKPGDSPIIIWCDEAQDMLSSFDSPFLAKSRSHMGSMVYLTQSLHSYYSEMQGQAAKNRADALLTNFGLKIFHTLGDFKSAEYASSLLGNRRESFTSFSPDMDATYMEGLRGKGGNVNMSEQYMPVLQPAVFMSGMRNGGKANGYMVDGIAIKSGQCFRWGENYIEVEFSQK